MSIPIFRRRFASGGGGAPPATIAQDVAGLILYDDFDRADGAPGGNWVTEVGTVAIVSNELSVAGNGGVNSVRSDEHAGLVTGFVQTHAGSAAPSGSNRDPGVALRSLTFATGDGYLNQWDGSQSDLDIHRLDAGVKTELAHSDMSAGSGGTRFPWQFAVGVGYQEHYMDDGIEQTASAADATHDAELKKLSLHKLETFGNAVLYSDVWWCRSKNIVVAGLPTGWKAKVVNAGASVVAEATESSGTATIDASLFGGCTEEVPAAGWPTLRITDELDVEQITYTDTGVFPGDEYTYTP